MNRIRVTVTILATLVHIAVRGDEIPVVAQKAKQLLTEKCYSCHGEDGANEGGFNFALNRNRLVGRLVVPEKPEDSILFERIQNGEMPEGDDPLTPDEQQIIRTWIEQGAPDFVSGTKKTEFIEARAIFDAIKGDLESSAEADQRFYRYFTITHLVNAGYSDDEIQSHRAGLSKLVNSLSWGRRVAVPKAIDEHRTVFRIDLRDYKWNENEAWNAIAAADPYKVSHQIPSAVFSIKATGSETPVIRADWFVHAASRPPLYHDVLGIPKQVEELEKRLEVNVAKNLQDRRAVRAGFYPSGVSRNNRMIERHESPYGAYWKSYDFAGNKDNQNLFSHPLGPGGDGGFEHDGGEMIFNLPNGLQGYMLTDAGGKRIDKGPTNVVVDKGAVAAGRAPEVVNGVSCMRCHWRGMIDKQDMVRAQVENVRSSFAEDEYKTILALYPENRDFEVFLKEDAVRFARAVEKCGAPLSKSEPVATLALQFENSLTIETASAEAGVSVEEFRETLQESPRLGRTLGNLLQPGGTIARDTFERNFASLNEQIEFGTTRNSEAGLTRVFGTELPAPAPLSFTSRPDFYGESTRYLTRQMSWALHLVQTEDPRLRIEIFSSTGLELLLVPAQTLVMDKSHEEKKNGQIDLDVFYVARHIRREMWQKVMGAAADARLARFKAGRIDAEETRNHSVSGVTPAEAEEFCRRLTKLDRAARRIPPGWVYRLPTIHQVLGNRENGLCRISDSGRGFKHIKSTDRNHSLAQMLSSIQSLPVLAADAFPISELKNSRSYPRPHVFYVVLTREEQ